MSTGKSRFESGLEVRRSVLGKEYVDKALGKASDFTRPLQELITEYAWGYIWARPGLPRKIRSLVNIAMLTALNRPHELKLHVQGAIRNGCAKEEIMEVLLQGTVYCGAPAGVDAFRAAEEALKELQS